MKLNNSYYENDKKRKNKKKNKNQPRTKHNKQVKKRSENVRGKAISKREAEQIAKRQKEEYRKKLIAEKQRKKKRKHKKNYILYYILISFIIIITTVILSYTVLFNIEKITVTGNNTELAEDIISSARVNKGNNLLRISTGNIKKNIINKYNEFDDVIVKRKFPNELSIQVKPAVIKSEIYYNNKYYGLSGANRIIYENDEQSAEDIMTMYGIDLDGQVVGDYIDIEKNEKLEIAKKIFDTIQGDSSNTVKAIDIKDIMSVKIYVSDRFIINLGDIKNLENKLNRANSLITQRIDEDEKGVLDVSNDKKAYFRPLQKLPDPKEEYIVSSDGEAGNNDNQSDTSSDSSQQNSDTSTDDKSSNSSVSESSKSSSETSDTNDNKLPFNTSSKPV